MQMTRKGFMAGLSAAVIMDWTQGLAAGDAAERPFGEGSSVLAPRIRRLLREMHAHAVIPNTVRVDYDPTDAKLPEPVRIGKRLAQYMAAQPVTIRPDDELVGWLPFDGSVEADFYRRIGHPTFNTVCMRDYYLKPKDRLAIFEWQHSCADYPKILRTGLVGLRREIAASRAKWAGDRARLEYLHGLELALDGIVARARNCAAKCRALAETETNPVRRTTLLEMAKRCDRVPLNPAETFDEAVQCVCFCYEFLPDAIGRLDQYLKPYYFADLKAGRITRDHAAERLQELFIYIDAHTPPYSGNWDKGGECHMTVGGLTPEGEDGWTDFSRLVVEASMSCDLIRPEMSFRWNPKTKREVLRFMLDCERRDPNRRIAFDGDVPRVAAFERRFHLPPATARDYVIVGCNEPTFMGGASYGGFHANGLRCMERVFTVRRDEALACETWDAFAALFVEELNHDLEEADALSKSFNAVRAKDCNVLSALFMDGCIDRAEGPTRGGARRSCPCIDLHGTPNLIDSLCIVRQFVFDEKRCTMRTLADALAADWKGYERLREEIRRDGKFYGGNDPLSNEMARFYHTALARFAKGRTDYFGLPLAFGNHTGYNDNATQFGRLTGATPDGRHAGDFLSFGGGPSAGHGTAATSVLLAAARMDPEGVMCGTSILNLTLPESAVTDEREFEKMVALVETYFREGGLHLQLNHVSRETLLAAQREPEKYGHIRVRISGFTGYFVRFKKTIQDEVISRAVTPV